MVHLSENTVFQGVEECLVENLVPTEVIAELTDQKMDIASDKKVNLRSYGSEFISVMRYIFPLFPPRNLLLTF